MCSKIPERCIPFSSFVSAGAFSSFQGPATTALNMTTTIMTASAMTTPDPRRDHPSYDCLQHDHPGHVNPAHDCLSHDQHSYGHDGWRMCACITLLFIYIYICVCECVCVYAEPRWPSGNTLAFNAEDPGSTPGPGVG